MSKIPEFRSVKGESELWDIRFSEKSADKFKKVEVKFGLDLIREEVRRRRINKLFESADLLADLDLPPLTELEVESEIEKVRKENRVQYAGCG